tara:strand:+ start:91999 stop:92220 length:222 start_codon:yes stop_codon:yes gene_type:complete
MDPIEELKAIKEELIKDEQEDVIQRTLSKLIAIEKSAVYGGRVSNKAGKIESVIDSEFKVYKENSGASKKNKA